MKIDVKLFNTDSFTLKKSKHHYIELLPDRLIFSASYLAEEKRNEQWEERLRVWHQTFWRSSIAAWEYALVTMDDDGENVEVWKFSISFIGVADDVVLVFESKENAVKFHELFEQWINK